MMIMEYESLMDDPREILNQIGSFLELCSPISIPEVYHESRDKWRTQLDASEIRQIDELLHQAPD